MVKQGLYIYAWPLVSYGVMNEKLFDKLTVKPNIFCWIFISNGVSSESAATGLEYAHPDSLKYFYRCFLPALSVRMLESVEPFSTITVF